jgi:hypothetical protein
VAALQQLKKSGRMFHTEELMEHIQNVGEAALRTVVVDDNEARLGNPVIPPGFKAYRELLCERTARGYFMTRHTRQERIQFMKDMKTRKDVWWKDVREVHLIGVLLGSKCFALTEIEAIFDSRPEYMMHTCLRVKTLIVYVTCGLGWYIQNMQFHSFTVFVSFVLSLRCLNHA